MYVDLNSPFLARVLVNGREIECVEADDAGGYADELILEKNNDRPGYKVAGIERRYGVVNIERLETKQPVA